ncbi:MAG TPA: cysteine hydrolase [Clostridia bacterium]|nr:cysteine hydrolase [Clostridia bacterium]
MPFLWLGPKEKEILWFLEKSFGNKILQGCDKVSKKAVLVIDMLVDFIYFLGALYVGDEPARVVFPIADLLERERAEGTKIIYVCDRHKREDAEFKMFPPHCIEGTKGAGIVSELKPQEGDLIIYKRRYSAFSGTDLDITLREHGINELVLVGVCTNICVLYTAADARNLNYSVSVPKNCVASFDSSAHEFALKEMENTLGVKVF